MSIASSADGSKLVAVAGLRTASSTNFGATWLSLATPNKAWYSVASSADGTRLAAVAYGAGAYAAANGTYISTNYAASWFKTSAPGSNSWSIACSADGAKLVATTLHGTIYLST